MHLHLINRHGEKKGTTFFGSSTKKLGCWCPASKPMAPRWMVRKARRFGWSCIVFRSWMSRSRGINTSAPARSWPGLSLGLATVLSGQHPGKVRAILIPAWSSPCMRWALGLGELPVFGGLLLWP